MKKLLVGCLFFFLVLAVVGSVGGYFFVYRPAKTFVTDIQEFTEWEDRLDESGSYEPPADGIMTADQIERFVAVQTVIDERLGSEVERVTDTLGRLNRRNNLDATEAWRLFREVRGLFGDAKDARDAQIEAMNEQGFSADEYDWIQARILESLWPGDTIENLESLIGEDGTITLPTTTDAESMAEGENLDMTAWSANREVLSAHLVDLPRWARFWPLGF
jgi:hypothetical protein